MNMRQRIAELEVKVKEEKEFSARKLIEHQDVLQKICIALGIYQNEEIPVILERVRKLSSIAESEKMHQVMVESERMGYKKASDSQLEQENAKLWFLLRSLIGDKTLEAEMKETVTMNCDDERYSGRSSMRINNNPFAKKPF